jgi:DHA1 family tetracycline resistance protein-like MFS transporter
MAGHVPSNQQGELQGSLSGLMSLTTIFGPIIMASIFHRFTAKTAGIYFPGAPFMLGALLMVASVFFAYKSLHGKELNEVEMQVTG